MEQPLGHERGAVPSGTGLAQERSQGPSLWGARLGSRGQVLRGCTEEQRYSLNLRGKQADEGVLVRENNKHDRGLR